MEYLPVVKSMHVTVKTKEDTMEIDISCSKCGNKETIVHKKDSSDYEEYYCIGGV
jgi:hypothetical protein